MRSNENLVTNPNSFSGIWASLSKCDKIALRDAIIGEVHCTSATIRNWVAGRTEPVSYPVKTIVANIINKKFSEIIRNGKVSPTELFPE